MAGFVGFLAGGSVANASSGFSPGLGVTRAQVEQRFKALDRGHLAFHIAAAVKGVPRVLGADRRLYTLVSVDGYPDVQTVQLVTLINAETRSTLNSQVRFDARSCAQFAGASAERWCASRVLNTNQHGLVDAKATSTFGSVSIAVQTYQAKAGGEPPVASITVSPASG